MSNSIASIMPTLFVPYDIIQPAPNEKSLSIPEAILADFRAPKKRTTKNNQFKAVASKESLEYLGSAMLIMIANMLSTTDRIALALTSKWLACLVVGNHLDTKISNDALVFQAGIFGSLAAMTPANGLPKPTGALVSPWYRLCWVCSKDTRNVASTWSVLNYPTYYMAARNDELFRIVQRIFPQAISCHHTCKPNAPVFKSWLKTTAGAGYNQRLKQAASERTSEFYYSVVRPQEEEVKGDWWPQLTRKDGQEHRKLNQRLRVDIMEAMDKEGDMDTNAETKRFQLVKFRLTPPCSKRNTVLSYAIKTTLEGSLKETKSQLT